MKPKPKPKLRRGRRLGSAVDVQRAFAWGVRGLENGKLTPNEARAYFSGLSGLLKAIDTADFERRLVALERRLNA